MARPIHGATAAGGAVKVSLAAPGTKGRIDRYELRKRGGVFCGLVRRLVALFNLRSLFGFFHVLLGRKRRRICR